MLKNTIHVIKENECTGCGACYNKCPVHAIDMRENGEGFLFPHINEKTCIRCGLCLKSCPVPVEESLNVMVPDCYAFWANDDIRSKSSSGGVFTLVAEYILEKGGYVCGAAYSDDYKKVEHILVSNKESLNRLRGSKYVQSDTGIQYQQIEVLLKDNKYVLFSGCPCQVAGLYKYLGKQYDTLYTLDLVCHGVPSPKAFRKFIENREQENGPIKYLSFRDKGAFGWTPSTYIVFDNDIKFAKCRKDSSWMKSFLELVSIRRSCGNCRFARIPRQGDLTLADFWNIGQLNADFDDGKGTSMVLINNTHGQELFDSIKLEASLCQKASLEFAKKNNAQLHSSSLLHPRRDRFFHLLDIYNFDKAVDYSINRRFDIGYVGWWYGLNYGSALTNYALYETLISLGKTVLMLEWPMKKKPKNPPPDTHTRRFAKRHYDMSLQYTYDELERLNYHCESFVVGSDQLWNYYSVADNGNYFFLDFVHQGKRKIAYATSFGHSQSFFPQERQAEITKYLQQFFAISVREKDGINICRRVFGVDAVQTLDPVFLCDQAAYENAIKDAEISFNEPYILAYILNPTPEKRQALYLASKKLGLPIKVILDGQENYEKNRQDMDMGESVLKVIGVEDWLYCFKNAQFILTDSYHGMCFSIIFQKNFICFGNKKRGMSRFDTLLAITNLYCRMVPNISNKKIEALLYQDIDYSDVILKINIEKERSIQWLTMALNSPLPSDRPLVETILKQIEELQTENKNLDQRLGRLEACSAISPVNQSQIGESFLQECQQASDDRIKNQLKKSRLIRKIYTLWKK